jgi:hypothetical protein
VEEYGFSCGKERNPCAGVQHCAGILRFLPNRAFTRQFAPGAAGLLRGSHLRAHRSGTGRVFPYELDRSRGNGFFRKLYGLKWFWKGCKPSFVFTLTSGENHLSQRPIPGTHFAVRKLERAAPWSPIWPCTRWGFPCPQACAWSGGLLLHLFTLTPLLRAERYIFCGTIRRDASRHRLPRVSLENLSYAASRPSVLGLSSPAPQNGPGAILRPSKTDDEGS